MSKQEKRSRSSFQIILTSSVSFTIATFLINAGKQRLEIADYNIFTEGIFNLRFLGSYLIFFLIHMVMFIIMDSIINRIFLYFNSQKSN